MIPVLAVAALIAGCGGGSGESVGQPAAATSAKKIVDMTGSTFAPQTLDAKVGDTISFVNKDEIAHNATGDGIDSGTLAGGATFDFKAAKAGTINYVCTFHPGMTGTINVAA
jgi:plastocyanin